MDPGPCSPNTSCNEFQLAEMHDGHRNVGDESELVTVINSAGQALSVYENCAH